MRRPAPCLSLMAAIGSISDMKELSPRDSRAAILARISGCPGEGKGILSMISTCRRSPARSIPYQKLLVPSITAPGSFLKLSSIAERGICPWARTLTPETGSFREASRVSSRFL